MLLPELASFIAKAGKRRSPDPQALAQTVQQVARESYRIRPELAYSVQFILASILRNLQALKASLREIDAAIQDAGKGFLHPLLSVPGTGPVYTSALSASIGDIRRFPSEETLAKMAGLVWRRNQSGEFRRRRGASSAPRIATFGIIWSRPPTRCGCTTRSAEPTIRRNTRR